MRRFHLCFLALLFAGAAWANTQEDPLFDRLDTDLDGFISRTEAVEDRRVAERFDALDTNRDERLDKIEFEALDALDKRNPQPSPPQP